MIFAIKERSVFLSTQCIVGYCFKYTRSTYDWFCGAGSRRLYEKWKRAFWFVLHSHYSSKIVHCTFYFCITICTKLLLTIYCFLAKIIFSLLENINIEIWKKYYTKTIQSAVAVIRLHIFYRLHIVSYNERICKHVENENAPVTMVTSVPWERERDITEISPLWELLPFNLSWSPIGSRQSNDWPIVAKHANTTSSSQYKCDARDNYIRIGYWTP